LLEAAQVEQTKGRMWLTRFRPVGRQFGSNSQHLSFVVATLRAESVASWTAGLTNSDGCRLAQPRLSYLSSTSTNPQPSEFVVLPARDSSHLEFSFEVRSTPVW